MFPLEKKLTPPAQPSGSSTALDRLPKHRQISSAARPKINKPCKKDSIQTNFVSSCSPRKGLLYRNTHTHTHTHYWINGICIISVIFPSRFHVCPPLLRSPLVWRRKKKNTTWAPPTSVTQFMAADQVLTQAHVRTIKRLPRYVSLAVAIFPALSACYIEIYLTL
ncbi:hypothetical protein GGI42DRAFT_106725 [Trichoderma sp. SZMC 28013]